MRIRLLVLVLPVPPALVAPDPRCSARVTLGLPGSAGGNFGILWGQK